MQIIACPAYAKYISEWSIRGLPVIAVPDIDEAFLLESKLE
jgi:hypothetical protein